MQTITERNLRSVDLNLLVMFDALMAERHVTRAARHNGISQPAMSKALNRLRHLLDDPLFERRDGRMEPTPRALDLAGPIRSALSDISRTLTVSGMRIPLLSAGLREAMCPGRTGSASRTGAWLQRRSGCRATRLGRRTACLDRAIVCRERGDRRGPRSGTRSAAAVRVRWRSGSAIGTTRTAAVS